MVAIITPSSLTLLRLVYFNIVGILFFIIFSHEFANICELVALTARLLNRLTLRLILRVIIVAGLTSFPLRSLEFALSLTLALHARLIP